jgi:hypothetical protein
VIGIHSDAVVAADRIAIDQQVPAAMAADMAQADRLEGFAIGRHARINPAKTWVLAGV